MCKQLLASMLAIVTAVSSGLSADHLSGGESRPVSEALKAKVNVNIEAQPLRHAVEHCLGPQFIPWAVDASTQSLFDQARADPLQLATPISIYSTLRLLLQPHGLCFVDDGNILQIMSEDKAPHYRVNVVYRVDDLVSLGIPLDSIVELGRSSSTWPQGCQIVLLDQTSFIVRNALDNQRLIAAALRRLRQALQSDITESTAIHKLLRA